MRSRRRSVYGSTTSVVPAQLLPTRTTCRVTPRTGRGTESASAGAEAAASARPMAGARKRAESTSVMLRGLAGAIEVHAQQRPRAVGRLDRERTGERRDRRQPRRRGQGCRAAAASPPPVADDDTRRLGSGHMTSRTSPARPRDRRAGRRWVSASLTASPTASGIGSACSRANATAASRSRRTASTRAGTRQVKSLVGSAHRGGAFLAPGSMPGRPASNIRPDAQCPAFLPQGRRSSDVGSSHASHAHPHHRSRSLRRDCGRRFVVPAAILEVVPDTRDYVVELQCNNSPGRRSERSTRTPWSRWTAALRPLPGGAGAHRAQALPREHAGRDRPLRRGAGADLILPEDF